MKTHLLRTFITLLIIYGSFSARAQWVSIPDTNFGLWLYDNGYNTCVLGNLMIGFEIDTTCPYLMVDTAINCGGHGIRDLTGIQYFDNLRMLGCSDNQLTTLPPLPGSIKELWCDQNLLTSLPVLPEGLITFDCSYNQLTSLPALPGGLVELYCEGNQLTNLPALPDSLFTLSCSFNQLTTLPSLPADLSDLSCYSNQLTALPALPYYLSTLRCDSNQLTTLPLLPPYLSQLFCSANQITTLPALPDYMINCFVAGNPLTCFPYYRQIFYLDISGTLITCLSNYGFVVNCNPPLNTLPLCEVFNENGCSVYHNISGKVYSDNNSNCTQEGTEEGVVNVPVKLWRSNTLEQRISTVGLGSYSFDTDTFDTYSIAVDTTNTPFHVLCPIGGIDTVTVTALDSMRDSRNFALNCKPGFDLKAQSIEGRFRPANFSTVNIGAGDATNFYGAHCAAGTSGAVTVTISGPVTYVSVASGALTPTLSGNTLTYNIADFGNVNFFSDFNFVLQTDTNATLGSQVCITVSVTPTVGDNNPANNTLTHCFTVVGSYDPNDKTAYPAGDIDTAQEWLTYTVRFQNTGTAEAQHIYITDTLDTDLDVSSFQLLAYSHQPMVQIKGSELRFNFPNINLPDSNTNEPASHGYVQYKIKLKDNLPIGTVVNNTAFIYFDFNAPVVTNTTTNTIALVNGIREMRDGAIQFSIYPNPASDVVTISVGEHNSGSVVHVSDVAGRKLMAVPLSTAKYQLSTSSFESGVYFVTVIDKEGRSGTKKLVISK